ncbi:MAG TPA: sugar phosphate nucleotidyltransferase, partial [Solirubrobacterales bacterium]
RVVSTDYGVIHVNGSTGETSQVTGYEEKPEIPYVVSMGVYVAEPEVLSFIPEGEHFDVPELVVSLLEAGKPVGSYLYEGFWLDIGRHDDYEQAIAEYEQRKDELFRTPDVAGA